MNVERSTLPPPWSVPRLHFRSYCGLLFLNSQLNMRSHGLLSLQIQNIGLPEGGCGFGTGFSYLSACQPGVRGRGRN
jgi:hypothetical protein